MYTVEEKAEIYTETYMVPEDETKKEVFADVEVLKYVLLNNPWMSKRAACFYRTVEVGSLECLKFLVETVEGECPEFAESEEYIAILGFAFYIACCEGFLDCIIFLFNKQTKYDIEEAENIVRINGNKQCLKYFQTIRGTENFQFLE